MSSSPCHHGLGPAVSNVGAASVGGSDRWRRLSPVSVANRLWIAMELYGGRQLRVEQVYALIIDLGVLRECAASRAYPVYRVKRSFIERKRESVLLL
jgi:hypothetical protein